MRGIKIPFEESFISKAAEVWGGGANADVLGIGEKGTKNKQKGKAEFH
jgi:hypothetical protein